MGTVKVALRDRFTATVSSVWSILTDKQKMMITIAEAGCPIDRVGRTSFWAVGRRFIFDNNGQGALCRIMDYTTDGRMSHSARPSAD